MEVTSVRELKRTLQQDLMPRVFAAVRDSAAVSARRVEEIGPAFRSVALGITNAEPGKAKLAVRVQDRALLSSSFVDEITNAASNEVDIRYTGRIRKQVRPWHQTRQRPLLIGVSCGHYQITAGTLGCFAKAKESVGLVSNNHVLADENRATFGDPIVQPGTRDGGRVADDSIATLTAFVPIDFRGPNRTDCAFAELRGDTGYESNLLKTSGQEGTLKGMGASLEEGPDLVEKIGRTTGHTRGRIEAFELDGVTVSFDSGNAIFDNQISIEGADSKPFSRGGDSGSLIYRADLTAVGLLFAGSEDGGQNGQGLTFANPLAEVLDSLAVELILE